MISIGTGMRGVAIAAVMFATTALAHDLNLPRQQVELVTPPFVHPHQQGLGSEFDG